MNFFKRKAVRYSLLALLLLGAGAAYYGYTEYNRKVKDIATMHPDFTIQAAVLLDEFSKNDSLSSKKYLDKVVAITGVLKSLDKDEKGFFTVVLGDPAANSSIRCSMDSAHNAEAATLSNGSIIEVKAICTGYNADDLGLGADVMFNHSCIIKK